MTEPERTERPYRGPLPGEVPLSRDSRPGGVLPGLTFDDATGRVVRAGEEEPAASSGPAPAPAPTPPSDDPPARIPDRAPSRAQRRTDDRAMVPLLAQALSSQLARLASHDDRAPDGWWFTPDR